MPERDEASRSVTRADRGFGEAELAELGRADLRVLCHAMLVASGVTVENYGKTVDYDEFTIAIPVIWRSQRVIVRIFDRAVEQKDLDDLRDVALSSRISHAIAIPSMVSADTLDPPPGIEVMAPAHTAARITESPLVAWSGTGPSPAVDRLELFLKLGDATRLLDPVGIQWLPSLALNELPPTLYDVDVEPQDLLERKTFRLLTATFLFGGVRYGEAARGQRLPDSVVTLPGQPTAALVDCKAAAGGYRMNSDHLLRFVEYWEALSDAWAAKGSPLEYLLVVSSFFPGIEGDRHPYNNRATELYERTGLKLCYLSASDLAWTAAEVEASDLSLDARQAFDWRDVLDQGQVVPRHLAGALGRVAE